MVKVNEEKHIHTLECFSSSNLCDSVIKHYCEVGKVLQNPKTFVNNSEENLPVLCGSGMSVVNNSTHWKNHTPIRPLVKTSGFLGDIS